MNRSVDSFKFLVNYWNNGKYVFRDTWALDVPALENISLRRLVLLDSLNQKSLSSVVYRVFHLFGASDDQKDSFYIFLES